DIFSFGCVLYEMVTGRRPFERPTSADTMVAILHENPPALSASGKDRPGGRDRVTTRCLAKNAADRYSSARELAAALRTLLTQSALTDTGKPPPVETVTTAKPPSGSSK